MKTMKFDYPVQLESDPGGGFTVTCRDVPQMVTEGETLRDALKYAVDALETALEFYTEAGRDIPTPSKPRRGEHTVRPSSLICTKLSVYQAMKDTGVGKAEMSRRLGCHLPQVDRILDLRHASRLDQVEAALAALGLAIKVEIVPVAA